MISKKPEESPPPQNAEGTPALTDSFVGATAEQNKQAITADIENRYRIFYGAVYNLLTEYFVQTHATETNRNAFEFRHDYNDAGFGFSIRPLPTQNNISDLHKMADDFFKDLDSICDRYGLDEMEVDKENDKSLYSGNKRYMFVITDNFQLMTLVRAIDKRMNFDAVREETIFERYSLKSPEEKENSCPKMIGFPTIDLIELYYANAQEKLFRAEDNPQPHLRYMQ